MADLRVLILQLLEKDGTIRAADIARKTGTSRAYVHRILQKLQSEGHIARLGKANRARYVRADSPLLEETRKTERHFHRILRNQNLEEDLIVQEVRRETGILLEMPANIIRIVEYTLAEMINNAIDHSGSHTIDVKVDRTEEGVTFRVRDFGVGIFRHIVRSRGLRSEVEAIQDLLKGKQTTAPDRHSGEGIFFTSRVADRFLIKSFQRKLLFDNALPDVFIMNARSLEGTEVVFSIAGNSRRDLLSVFKQYTGEDHEFGTTEVRIQLHTEPGSLLSRSQARRVVAGLEKFSTVILDFRGVETIGQSFADEIFRIWNSVHPHTSIKYMNANENVEFMIRHVRPKE